MNSPRPSSPAAFPPSGQSNLIPSPTSAQDLAGSEKPAALGKDLSFLLDPSIYHSLAQFDVSPPFRRESRIISRDDRPVQSLVEEVDNLLTNGDLIHAAQLSSIILTSGKFHPTDTAIIFHLVGIRYGCLELLEQTALAAQESKALLDISSPFYYIDEPNDKKLLSESRNPPEHIMPYELRLQALRLQSIGFSDPRRLISSLYELAEEIRTRITFIDANDYEDITRKVWTNRLEELGLRIADSLVELGDMEGARRSLLAMNGSLQAPRHPLELQRKFLLHLRLGDLPGAKRYLQTGLAEAGDAKLTSLLLMAEGSCTSARDLLQQERQRLSDEGKTDTDLEHNLAVAYLYCGEMEKARDTLQRLVADGADQSSLLLNLCTIYELCSDRSRELKAGLAELVAEKSTREKAGKTAEMGRTRMSADFKL